MRFLLLAVVALAGCGSEPVVSGSPAADEPGVVWREVASWSGRGNRLSETFNIQRHRWRVKWSARNESGGTGSLRVSVHSGDSGRTLDVPVEHQGTGQGIVEVIEEPRQFYLTFESAHVDWSVAVEEAIP